MVGRGTTEWLSGEPDHRADDEVAVSVVIPTFNRLDVLPEVLAAALSQHGAPTYEVVVIDDGSADETSLLPTHRGHAS